MTQEAIVTRILSDSCTVIFSAEMQESAPAGSGEYPLQARWFSDEH